MKTIFLTCLVLFNFCASAQVDTVKHHYYTIVYSRAKKDPIYTYYTLTKVHLNHVIDRKSTFYTDPAIPKANQANNKMYVGETNYDKGHLSPAADFCFDSIAYRESMYLTNTAPQQEYFNEHLWEAVEEGVRDSCRKYGNIKVFTGCLYGTKLFHGVALPEYYWKVIIYNHGMKAGWLGKNVLPASNNPNTIKHSVSDIEAKTHLIFQ